MRVLEENTFLSWLKFKNNFRYPSLIYGYSSIWQSKQISICSGNLIFALENDVSDVCYLRQTFEHPE